CVRLTQILSHVRFPRIADRNRELAQQYETPVPLTSAACVLGPGWLRLLRYVYLHSVAVGATLDQHHKSRLQVTRLKSGRTGLEGLARYHELLSGPKRF